MKKNDLRNGAIIETYNGEAFLKVDNSIFDLKGKNSYSLDYYDDDLKCPFFENDVVRVWNDVVSGKSCTYGFYRYLNGYPSTWERTKEKSEEDVENTKTGRWINSADECEKYVCSECGCGAWYYDVTNCVTKSRYCPSCGAKMGGVRNDIRRSI